MMQLGMAATSAVNPFLGVAGPIAAIIIGLYMVIFIILALAVSVLAAFLAYWVHNKAEVIKVLRPTVDSVNKTTEALQRGVAPEGVGNDLIRTIAQSTVRVQTVDRQMTRISDRVVSSAIELRARSMQVKAVARAFLRPSPLASAEVARYGAEFAEQPGVDGSKATEQAAAIERPVPEAAPVGSDLSRPRPRPRGQSVETFQRNNVPAH